MIDLHFWPTPNGYKVLIALEEMGLEYRLLPVDIFRGAQFDPAFLAIAPNNRMPAIVDTAPIDGGGPIALFESGEILLYLAERAGRLLPTNLRARHEVQQWLFWQMAGLGPMMGQAAHFMVYAPEDVPYAKRRYRGEVQRLFSVLERQLADRNFIGEHYSIADIACYPWVRIHGYVDLELVADFRSLGAWLDRIADREAVKQAYAIGEPLQQRQTLDDVARRHLFGQGEKPVLGTPT